MFIGTAASMCSSPSWGIDQATVASTIPIAVAKMRYSQSLGIRRARTIARDPCTMSGNP